MAHVLGESLYNGSSSQFPVPPTSGYQLSSDNNAQDIGEYLKDSDSNSQPDDEYQDSQHQVGASKKRINPQKKHSLFSSDARLVGENKISKKEAKQKSNESLLPRSSTDGDTSPSYNLPFGDSGDRNPLTEQTEESNTLETALDEGLMRAMPSAHNIDRPFSPSVVRKGNGSSEKLPSPSTRTVHPRVYVLPNGSLYFTEVSNLVYQLQLT